MLEEVDKLTDNNNPEITVVLPCLNEAEAVSACVEEAFKGIALTGLSGEVIVVDNGSTDASEERAKSAGARVVRESRKGYGSAYLRGFAEAKGNYVIMADADGTYDLTQIPEFIERLRSGDDFVNGSRARGAIPFLHRYVGVPILTWVLNILSGTRFSDAHCGIRGFTKEAIKRMRLRTTGMEFASEIILQSARAKLKTSEMAVPYRERTGESKLRSFPDGWRHLRFMFLYSPNALFIVPGLSAFVLGKALMWSLVWGPLAIGNITLDYHYMIGGSVIAIMGFQALLLGLHARIYFDTVGLTHDDPLVSWISQNITLERGLVFGLLLIIGGVILFGWLLNEWLSGGEAFASNYATRIGLLGLTLLVIGVQAIFSSFFLSILGISVVTTTNDQ